MCTNNLLIISGPTASGKSALALRLAEALNGEIINIDAVQVYRGLDIGTAKATSAERERVRHHLLDLYLPGEQCNAAEFVRSAVNSIGEVRARGRLPICAGGSTMYLTSLLHGLAPLPPAQRGLRSELEMKSDEELYAQLSALDREAAGRIHPHDRVRMVRAIETVLTSGSTAGELQAGQQKGRYAALILVLCRPREELYRRIDERAEEMVQAGLIEETERLLRESGRDLPPLASVGYCETVQYLEGKLSREELPPAIATATRRLAKRQLTFWRNEPLKRQWLVRPGEGEGTLLNSRVEALAMRKPVKDFRVLQLTYPALLTEIEHSLGQPLEKSELWYLDAASL